MKSNTLNNIISIKFDDTELEEVESAAKAAKINRHAWVRETILNRLKRVAKRTIRREAAE